MPEWQRPTYELVFSAPDADVLLVASCGECRMIYVTESAEMTMMWVADGHQHRNDNTACVFEVLPLVQSVKVEGSQED